MIPKRQWLVNVVIPFVWSAYKLTTDGPTPPRRRLANWTKARRILLVLPPDAQRQALSAPITLSLTLAFGMPFVIGRLCRKRPPPPRPTTSRLPCNRFLRKHLVQNEMGNADPWKRIRVKQTVTQVNARGGKSVESKLGR